jgi:outer membrane lipoprotein SlyB
MARNYGLRKVIAGILILVLFSSCSQPLSTREKSTLVGGGLGAATGAIVGAAVGNPGAGAAIGGALGAGTGALIGDQFQKIENRQNAQQRQIQAQHRQIKRQGKEISRLKRKAKKKPTYRYE